MSFDCAHTRSGSDLYLINPMVASEETLINTDALLVQTGNAKSEESRINVEWIKATEKESLAGYRQRIQHRLDVTSVVWHKKGDYFATVSPDGEFG